VLPPSAKHGYIYYCFYIKNNLGIDSKKMSFMSPDTGHVQAIKKMDGPFFWNLKKYKGLSSTIAAM